MPNEVLRRIKEKREARIRNALMSAAESRWRSEIERLNQCLQWEQHRTDRVGTHSKDCHLWGPRHYECLLAENERLRDALRQIRDQEPDEGAWSVGVARAALGEEM